MATPDDAAMLAKISSLAGQINRHKNNQNGTTSAPATPPYASNTYQQPRGGYRGRGRGYARGGRAPPVRNRTLVLNGTGATVPKQDENATPGDAKTEAGPAWVTRNALLSKQIINPAIYQKHSETQAKAAEETRKLRLRQRDERERVKLNYHFQKIAQPLASTTAARSRTAHAPMHEIVIQDIRFNPIRGGSKLIKVPGDVNAAKATPKTAMIAGVQFHRSKSGNMYRAGVVKAQRGRRVIKRIDEQCKSFSNTGTCSKGSQCPYNHDAEKVGICKDFLKGTCVAGDSCDLSHDATPERTPHCLHFAKGHCSNASCRYTHAHISPNAPVCRSFGIYGYCDKGVSCQDRHVHECPDFSNTGSCKIRGCKLPHKLKASVIRKNGNPATDDQTSDLSSDDEEIGSDDVDSDDLEEFFGNEGVDKDGDIPMQQDFVHF